MWQHDPQHLRLSVCTHPLLYPPTYLTADGFSQCDCRQLMKITADICFVWSIRTVMTDRRQKSPYIPLLVGDNQKTFETRAWSEGQTLGQFHTNPADRHCVCFLNFADMSWFLCAFSIKWCLKRPESRKWQALSHSCARSPSLGHMSPQAHFKSRQIKRITDSPWWNSQRQSALRYNPTYLPALDPHFLNAHISVGSLN